MAETIVAEPPRLAPPRDATSGPSKEITDLGVNGTYT